MSGERGGGVPVSEVRLIYEEGDCVLVRFLTGFYAFVIQEREYREGSCGSTG